MNQPFTSAECPEQAKGTHEERLYVIGNFIADLRRARGLRELDEEEVYRTAMNWDEVISVVPLEDIVARGNSSLYSAVCAAQPAPGAQCNVAQVIAIWNAEQGQPHWLEAANRRMNDTHSQWQNEPEATGPNRRRLQAFIASQPGARRP